VLLAVLEQSLRLLHPFMPYVTEVLWQALPQEMKQGEALILASWPMQEPARLDDEAEAQMAVLMDLIRDIRNVRAEYNVRGEAHCGHGGCRSPDARGGCASGDPDLPVTSGHRAVGPRPGL
jgi:valyl-tRNA synthetase